MVLEFASLSDAWGVPPSLKKMVNRIGKREVEQKPPQVAPTQKLVFPNINTNSLENSNTNVNVNEGFDGNSNVFATERKSYAAQVNDYKLGCSMYGVCSPVEGFQSQSQIQSQNINPQSTHIPGSGAGSGSGNTVPCGPLELPVLGDMYGDQIKADMQKSLNTQLAQNSSPGTGYTPPTNYKNNVDMSKVTGFYDEEIEKYLFTNAMTVEDESKGGQQITGIITPPSKYEPYSNNSIANTPTPVNKPTDDNIHTTDKDESNTIIKSINHALKNLYETTTSYNPKNNIWDIAMFVLAGILIIVLLEQLFQIASAIGMRNTIAYLKSLDNI